MSMKKLYIGLVLTLGAGLAFAAANPFNPSGTFGQTYAVLMDQTTGQQFGTSGHPLIVSTAAVSDGFWVASSQPTNAWAQIVAPKVGTTYIDNVATMENDSVNSSGVCGNDATRYRDSVIHYERGAIGYSSVATGCVGGFFPDHLYGEIGNIGPASDPDDTSFAIVNTHAAAATHFPGTQFAAYEIRGDTNKNYWRKSTGAIIKTLDSELPGMLIGSAVTPVNALDVSGGLAVGANYAGVNTAPSNGALIQGNIGINQVSPVSKTGLGVQVEIDGSLNLDPAHSGNATNILSITRNVATDGIRYTQSGIGAVFMSFSTNAVFGSDSSTIDLKTGITGGDPSTGVRRMRITAAAPTISAGFGTSPAVNAGNSGPHAFAVVIGTTPGNTGTIAFPYAAANFWSCSANNLTTTSASVSFIKETAHADTTHATFTTFTDLSVAGPPNAADEIDFICWDY